MLDAGVCNLKGVIIALICLLFLLATQHLRTKLPELVRSYTGIDLRPKKLLNSTQVVWVWWMPVTRYNTSFQASGFGECL